MKIFGWTGKAGCKFGRGSGISGSIGFTSGIWFIKMGSTGLKTGAGRGSGTNGRRLSGSTSLKIWKTSGNSSGFFGNGILTTSCRTIQGSWDNFI